MGQINDDTTEMGAGLEYFNLCFFVDLLDVVFPDAEEGKGFFGAAPEVRGSTYVVVGSEEVEGIIEGMKEGSVVCFFKLNICFFLRGEVDIGLFIVGVKEVI